MGTPSISRRLRQSIDLGDNALFLARLLVLRSRGVRGGRFAIDGGCFIGLGPSADVEIGAGTRIRRGFNGSFQGRVRVGTNVFFNRDCYLACHESITIGSDCLLGERVSIHDADHEFGPAAGPDPLPLPQRPFRSAPVVIGDDVWISANVVITRGCTIGSGSVIGSNSVVTTSIPERSLAVGAPARVIRSWP
jgi:acetyltransferase-like isoleucine patch superfamily enzyme